MADKAARSAMRSICYLVAGLAIGIAVGFIVFGSASTPTAAPNLTQSYENAVRDSAFAQQSDICNNLTAIAPSDQNLVWNGTGSERRVLVATLTSYASSYPVGSSVNTSWGDTWVTAVPQVRSFFSMHVPPGQNLTLRSEQLLGLPPSPGSFYFVELWVKPSDLFRPAYDSRINTTSEQLAFPNSTNASYVAWFNNNILYSYFTKQYPSTR